MNILFLTRRFYPQVGGVETHLIEIGKRLVEIGLKVTVITEDFGSTSSHKNINGIEVVRIDAGREGRGKKFRIWRELWRKRDLFYKADIIHCHDVFFWYLPFRLLYLKKKVHTTFHGYETKFPPRISAIIIRKISEKLSRGNICIGDYISKWYGTKSTFITYGGVNVDKIKNLELRIKNSKSKLKIVLIGRLEDDIGINTYLKSLTILKKNKIKFNFEAVGVGSLSNKIKKYGKVIGLTQDIAKYIKDSDIIFCSSYLTMLQALSMRKPVIAVYENKLKEDYLRLSPFTRFIYVCKDAQEISEVVKSIQETPWKSNSMVDQGYKWAKEQTWEKIVDTYLELWKK